MFTEVPSDLGIFKFGLATETATPGLPPRESMLDAPVSELPMRDTDDTPLIEEVGRVSDVVIVEVGLLNVVDMPLMPPGPLYSSSNAWTRAGYAITIKKFLISFLFILV